MYKLRIYHTTGTKRGDLKEEKLFDTFEEMHLCYNSIFKYELFSLNPTAWEHNGNDWQRISGY